MGSDPAMPIDTFPQSRTARIPRSQSPPVWPQMIGTAGTVTTIAGIHLGLQRYNRSVVDGCRLDFDAVRTVSRMLAGSSFAERAVHGCIGTGRAELVVAGCAVLEAVCRTWPAGRLRVADRGVREGILLALADEVNGERRTPRVQ